MLEGLAAQKIRKREGAIFCGAQLLAPAPGSSKAKAARLCSATTEMGLDSAFPWEPAEGENPVSAMDCNGKGMERGSDVGPSHSQLCAVCVRADSSRMILTVVQKKSICSFKKHVRIPEIMSNKSFLYEADVQTRTKSPLTLCQNLDLR